MFACVGVTDSQWVRHLRHRQRDLPGEHEVNFWRPSGKSFAALRTGEPFLFKTHSPDNRLVGGGFFSDARLLLASEAWEFFGEGNGVSSLEELRRRIAHYRRAEISPREDPMIGCVLLRDAFFVSDEEALPAPHDFAANIVSYKRYDLAGAGSHLERVLEQLLHRAAVPTAVPGDVFGQPRLAATRLGQQAFKVAVLAAYQRRCAITGARIKPTLEAAHIRPVSEQGLNRVDNGVLLRSDIHTLFDRGYVGVDPQLRLRVSPRIRTDFGNGEELYSRAGAELVVLPARRVDRPDREALAWHMDTRFLAG